jgi:hypothetical protein
MQEAGPSEGTLPRAGGTFAAFVGVDSKIKLS